VLLLAGIVLTAAADLRGAEYDEQYTLFLTAGTPRPNWPEDVIAAGDVVALQSGAWSAAAIARDLRRTDVHPPLYFWAAAAWRTVMGDGLFTTRLLSVAFSLGALSLVGVIAQRVAAPAVLAMLLTLGCYGFAYTGSVARGFALAQLLTLGGIACSLSGWSRRPAARGVLAGVLLGAATLANYLAIFVATAVIGGIAMGSAGRPESGTARCRTRNARTEPRRRGQDAGRPQDTANHSAEGSLHNMIPRDSTLRPPGLQSVLPYSGCLAAGFILVLPAAGWFYLGQRGSRDGQFPPFDLLPALRRLATYAAANVLGGLPLYFEDPWRRPVGACLTGMLVILVTLAAIRWRRIAAPASRRLLLLCAAAPPIGLLILGIAFDNTPIELRYLAFATPFVGLLLAGAIGSLDRRLAHIVGGAVLATQTLALAGLMQRPETMQPARTVARSAAELAGDGPVLLPFGNDGVGIVGAFAREAPPALPLLVIRRDTTPRAIRARLASYHRVTLARLEQDTDSRATVEQLTAFFHNGCWRRVADRSNVTSYERTCEGAQDVFRGVHTREGGSAGWDDAAAPWRIGTTVAAVARQSANPCDVASDGADAGAALHGDLPGSARLRVLAEAGRNGRPCALRQDRDGEGHDRGDGLSPP
jgi:hypothetical protein